MIDEFTMRETAITRSRSTRIHYSGELRTRSKYSADGFRVIKAGYVACIDSGSPKGMRQGIQLRAAGRTTDDRAAVTCKVCRSLISHADALIASEVIASESAPTPKPEMTVDLRVTIIKRIDALGECQMQVNRARFTDQATKTPGCTEWLTYIANRDAAAAASGWLTRMKAEAHRIGLGPEFDKLEADHSITPNYTILLGEAAQAKRDAR